MPINNSSLGQLIEGIREAVIGVAPDDGRIVLWNDGAAQVFGYPAAEALGSPIDSIVVGLDPTLLRDLTALNHVPSPRPAGRGARGAGQLLELRARRRDGYELRAEVTLSAVQDAGRPIVIIIARDVTLRRVLEQRAVQAFRDPLTGLPNRALFRDRLEHALQREDRAEGSVALLFMDLDRFKLINDSLGHLVGDQLLSAAAKRIQGCLRTEDTASRLGGDEFTVLLEGIHDVHEAERIAERIANELRAPFQLGEHDVFVSASIGIAMAGEDAQPDDLLRDADVAMYRAKRLGNARYVVFDPSMNAHAFERLQLENDLRRALAQGEFELHYQPVVHLGTGRIQTFEALLRWRHPRRGLVLPEEFVPLADDMGLTVTIGQDMLRDACGLAKLLVERGAGELQPVVTVNLTARQFYQQDLAGEVDRALRGAGLPPHSLGIEVTESALMTDVPSAMVTLRALTDLGVSLTIDDFGMGFSSLAHLRQLTADYLKIDTSLVAGIGRTADDELVVSAIVGLAHALRYVVIAEGVEHREQVERLKLIGCDYGQGDFFSVPLRADELWSLVQGRLARSRDGVPS